MDVWSLVFWAWVVAWLFGLLFMLVLVSGKPKKSSFVWVYVLVGVLFGLFVWFGWSGAGWFLDLFGLRLV